MFNLESILFVQKRRGMAKFLHGTISRGIHRSCYARLKTCVRGQSMKGSGAMEAMTMTTTKSGVFVVAFLEGGANEGARAQDVPKTVKVAMSYLKQ